MAPEVISQSGLGRFSDIWSVGCTVLEMASGKPPWIEFSSDNPLKLMQHIAYSKQSPKIPEGLSDAARDFLEKCFS